jgi:hypothetical protein
MAKHIGFWVGFITVLVLLPFPTVATLNNLFGFGLDIWQPKVYSSALFFNLYFIQIHKGTIKEFYDND